MRLASRLVSGRFEARPNRFTVEARVAGEVVRAHLPNSGRLAELLRPGAPVRLAVRDEPWRRTAYDLVAVELGSGTGDPRAARWAVVDARLPARLVEEAWRAGKIEPFRGYTRVQAEPAWGEGRLDLRFSGGDDPDCLVETKSVTLVVGGEARFPDAPTARGRRHVRELAAAVRAGHRAAVVFVIQREDATRFASNIATDPDFAKALAASAAAGVEVYAYGCRVTAERIEIAEPVALRRHGLTGTPLTVGAQFMKGRSHGEHLLLGPNYLLNRFGNQIL